MDKNKRRSTCLLVPAILTHYATLRDCVRLREEKKNIEDPRETMRGPMGDLEFLSEGGDSR